MGQRKGSSYRLMTWPEETTPPQLVAYATREFARSLENFMEAERTQDTERMVFTCKLLRTVATRIDQYRRMRVRQWRVLRVSSPKSTSRETSSVMS